MQKNNLVRRRVGSVSKCKSHASLTGFPFNIQSFFAFFFGYVCLSEMKRGLSFSYNTVLPSKAYYKLLDRISGEMMTLSMLLSWRFEWIIEWMIYLMSKTWEVFAQSSEPEAHVKNARQTKKYKTIKMWIMHIQILRKT